MQIVEMFEKKALSAKLIQKNISKHLTSRFGGCIFVMSVLRFFPFVFVLGQRMFGRLFVPLHPV